MDGINVYSVNREKNYYRENLLIYQNRTDTEQLPELAPQYI